jgi:hypothetical protein
VPLRLGIPFSIVLLSLTAVPPAAVGRYVYAALTVMSALWVAVESRRLCLHRYKATMGLDPLAAAVVMLLAWPMAFPLFLRLRYRVGRQRQPLRGPAGRSRVGVAVVLSITVVTAVAAFYLGFRNAADARLTGVAEAVAGNFPGVVEVSLEDGPRLVIRHGSRAVPGADSARRSRAFEMAKIAAQSWPERSLSAVSVVLTSVEQRGALRSERTYGAYQWTRFQLLGPDRLPPSAADPHEDSLARSFIARAQLGDSTSALEMEGRSRASWGAITARLADLPPGVVDSLRLVAVERGSRGDAAHTNLVYEANTGADPLLIEVSIARGARRLPFVSAVSVNTGSRRHAH